MFFDNISVELPEKKRITQSRTGHLKNYVYEIINRKDKNHSKENTVCVGVLVNDKFMHPNEKYFDLHPDKKPNMPDGQEKEFDNQIHFGASIVMRSVSEQCGLKQAIDKAFPGYGEFIQTLIEYYLIRGQSASQLFKYYLHDHYTTLNVIPTEKKISLLFREIIGSDEINKFLDDWISSKIRGYTKNNAIEVDYDSTNINVNSNTIDMAEYGHPKVKEDLSQVNIAYFLDRNTGLPLYYDMYCGSLNDMSYCETAIAKIRALNSKSSIVFVMDRGYFSESNLKKIQELNYSYYCMGKKTNILQELINDNLPSSITKAKNRIKETIYGVHIKDGYPFGPDKDKLHIYLYYNAVNVIEDAPVLQDTLEKEAKRLIGKYDKNKKIENKYKGKINIIKNKYGEIIRAEVNYTYIDNKLKESGYFWIVSNEERDIKEVYESYRHRDAIEKIIRTIKSGADLNKAYVQSDSAVVAKEFLGFLAAIIHSQMMVNLNPYFIQYSQETIPTVLHEMDKIKCELWGEKYILKNPLTSKQKQILSHFGYTAKDTQKFIDELNFNLKLTEK